MDFKTTDALFNKIKEDLYSFDAAGLLDEGKFYKDVQYVLGSLGVMWYREVETMISIDGYRANLPKDFDRLDAVYRCQGCGNGPRQLPPGIVFTELTFDHYPETQIPDPHVPRACPADTDYWMQNGNKIFNSFSQLLVQRGDLVYSYHPPILMRAGNVNTRKMCTDRCPSVHNDSEHTFTIQNRKIYTNFKDGDIFMIYKAFPVDDETGLPMIPDNILIEKAIEDYIKYNIIKNLRTNGDASVAQLVSLYDKDMQLSMGKAITETKTPSFATMVHNVRLVRKRLNAYQFPQMNGR